MTEIYDFNAYRTIRLLGENSRQAERLSMDLNDIQGVYVIVAHSLNQSAEEMKQFATGLGKLYSSCQKSRGFYRFCEQVLDRSDIEEMVELRDKWMEVSSHYKLG